MTAKMLGRFDAAAVRRLFEATGVLRVLEQQRGFQNLEVVLDDAGRVLPHALIFGHKNGARYLLLDACVGEAVVRPDVFQPYGYDMQCAVKLAVVHWVREEDPTRPFPLDRPPLPLQRHPGLGVLRRAFRVVVQMAGELGKDGIASVPKFYHDALLFFHSRLFLFLDGYEQGRFEALARDLASLALGDISLAVAGDCVRDANGAVVRWAPHYQVFPLSEPLTAYFHSPQYATRVTQALAECRFTCDPAALRQTRAVIEAAQLSRGAPHV